MREERRTDPWVDPSSVIGREEDEKTLISKLIREDGSMTCGSGSDKVPSIFIWGMGGLGKTTLAKSIYNDQRVKEHFGGKCMWVCVGEVFNREVIMKSMIESWGESVKPSRREQLAEMLKDRKYLLILDDVWNEEYLEWEPLQEILNQGAKGSKIVITARNRGVGTMIGSAYTHELKGLGYDDSLSIFKKIVVEQGKEEEYEPLMDIGGEIVRKCGGPPLAVKTVATVIKGREPTKEQWDNIVNNNIIWDLSQSKAGILPALMLSYIELSPQLKNCFGYCSIFKKDTLLKKDKLIRLWVSQGYIVEEEIGEKCFKELLARSMFQEPERDEDGSITRCKMHDLVHDLAQWVTKEECRIIVSSGNDDANNNNNALGQLAGARHCAIRRKLSTGDINLAGVENLRTLIYSPNGELTQEPIDLVLKLLKSIRVLNLRNCSVGRHSWKHLGKLVHLRHLKLSGTTFTQLPAASIAKLKELMYFDLSGTCIQTLPENIGTLSSLRQLNVSWCKSLVNLPKTIVSLPHLQVINLASCYGLEELPELKDLPSLRQLNVSWCTSLVNLPKTIVSLPHLQVINLEGCYGLKELPELKDLTSLRELNVSWCTSLVNLPKTIVSLPHLQLINLSNCSGLEELPELKDLLSLRELNVSWCTSLVNLAKTIVSLPHLQVINLSNCSGLEELPELKDLPSLRELNFERCTSLVNLPKTIVSLPHLQVINLGWCSGLKELPEGILEMASLRQLNVHGCWGLKKLPNGIGRRKDVVVILDRFLVVAASRDAGGCSRSNIGELGGMNIRAEYLHICNLEEVGSRDEARTAKLEEKTSLGSLDLFWNEMDDVIAAAADGVLEGLRPPPSVVFLKIRNYPGQTFPSWMGDGGAAFRRLREVELWNCKNCNQLPPLGQLPSLSSLTIEGLDGVERVGREFFGGPSPTFPCLMDLTFQRMRNWSEWVALSPISSEGEEGSAESPIMPSLETLVFTDCPKLEAMPPIFATSLRSLIIQNCPKLSGRCRVGGELWPKIVHIPLIRIDGQDIQSA